MTGPEGWALRNGLLLKSLRPLGITQIKPVGFPNGPDASIAIASGAIDVATMGDFPGVIARGSGLQTRLIAITTGGGRSKTGNSTGILVLPGGPRRVEDLVGKKVGVPRGSNMERFLLGVLDLKKIYGKVQIIHIPMADEEAAARVHAVDAVVGGYSEVMKQHGFISIASADQYPQLASTGVTVASQKFLDEHPTFPRVWVRSRVLWYKDLVAHQDQYFAFAAANAKISVALYKATYPLALFVADPFTPEALKRLNGTKEFAKRINVLRNDFDINQWRAD